jgi:trans-aconitate methyltransferase
MLAEQLVRSGSKLVAGYAPEGRNYWAARFWDRGAAERDPVLGEHYRDQKRAIADLIDHYGAGADRVLELACGTGEFTRITADLLPAAQITALDISAQGLARTRERVPDERLRLVQGDFWADHNLAPAPLVICVDAIHHIGQVGAVLDRLSTFVAPGGVLIGNLWTLDHFHELQRQRYGPVRHIARCALFLASALMIRASGGRLRTASYRTQLLPSAQVLPLLSDRFGEVLAIAPDRFFHGFAVRP